MSEVKKLFTAVTIAFGTAALASVFAVGSVVASDASPQNGVSDAAVSTSGTTVESIVETGFEAVNGTARVNGEPAGPLRVETQSVSVTDGDDRATTAAQGSGFTLLQAGVGVAILAVVGWTCRDLRRYRGR